MMKLNRNLALLLIGLFALQLFCQPVSAAPRVKYVFIVSFDQGNPSLIERTDMPTFHELEANGAHAQEAFTIVPPLTLPSHTSMLTGVGIQKHQITWNDYRPTNGIVKVPTIFGLAKERGLKTAMFVGKEKFKHLELPGTIDELVWPQPDDDARSVAKVFAAEFGKTKPNLCFIHFRDPDTVGHKTGAYSPEKVQALKDCDDALKTIKDAIAA